MGKLITSVNHLNPLRLSQGCIGGVGFGCHQGTSLIYHQLSCQCHCLYLVRCLIKMTVAGPAEVIDWVITSLVSTCCTSWGPHSWCCHWMFNLEENSKTWMDWKNSFPAFLNLLTSSSLMVHRTTLNIVVLARHNLVWCENKIIMRKK